MLCKLIIFPRNVINVVVHVVKDLGGLCVIRISDLRGVRAKMVMRIEQQRGCVWPDTFSLRFHMNHLIMPDTLPQSFYLTKQREKFRRLTRGQGQP